MRSASAYIPMLRLGMVQILDGSRDLMEGGVVGECAVETMATRRLWSGDDGKAVGDGGGEEDGEDEEEDVDDGRHDDDDGPDGDDGDFLCGV